MAKRGIFNRIGRAFNELRGTSQVFGENQWSKLFTWMGGGEEENSGEVVSSETGTRNSTIYNCLNVLSQDVATFPKQIRKDTDDGRKSISNNLTRLLNQKPNKWENAWHFWYGMIFIGEGWGNSYAYITERDNKGYAIEAIRIAPWMVTTEVVDGELYYVIDNKVVVHSSDMLHYRSMVTDSYEGENKIVYNAKTVGLKLKQQKYTSKAVGNKPPGILFQEGTAEQAAKNREIWNAQVSGDNLAGTPVLSGTIDYKQLMMSPEATAIIEQHNLSDQYLMGIWRIQPAMLSIHEKSNYNVVEQQNINHVKYALMPIITNLEQEIAEKMFPESNKRAKSPEYVKFNVKSLLRGDTKTQTEFYRFMVTTGVFNADNVLALEDYPPQMDENGNTGMGKKYYIQGAMVEKGKEVEEIKPPTTEKENDKRTMELLEDFAKKHKLNGYSKQASHE